MCVCVHNCNKDIIVSLSAFFVLLLDLPSISFHAHFFTLSLIASFSLIIIVLHGKKNCEASVQLKKQ